MRLIISVIFLLTHVLVLSQEASTLDAKTLRAAAREIAKIRLELEAMLESDQAQRRTVYESEKKLGKDSAEFREIWTTQRDVDVKNIKRLEEIVSVYGWPDQTVFGKKAAMAAFLILQHADLAYQKKHLPAVREAAAHAEADAANLALLEDRVRLREGGKQIYGSQVHRNAADEWEPSPIEDEEKVDALRASVGLRPLAEYLQGFATRSGGRVAPRWEKAAGQKPNKAPEPTPTSVTPPANSR